MIEVLRIGKPLVAVSNPDRYDRHQDDILAAFSSRGYLTWCRNLSQLADALHEAGERRYETYVPPVCTIATEIRRYFGLAPE